MNKDVKSKEFYPKDPSELGDILSSFEGGAQPRDDVFAIICPHAGYVYSGRVAAAAYESAGDRYDRVVVLATPHTKPGGGMFVCGGESYPIPGGKVLLDRKTAAELVKSGTRVDDGAIQNEHTLDVQMPMISRWCPSAQVVPILIGKSDLSTLRGYAKILKSLDVPGTLFVISADFSHYPSTDQAREIDSRSAEALCRNDVNILIKEVRSIESSGIPGLDVATCSLPALVVMVAMTEGGPFTYEKILYGNSSDSGGDPKKTVGYWAICVRRTGSEKKGSGIRSVQSDPKKEKSVGLKSLLLGMAVDSVRRAAHGRPPATFDPKKLPNGAHDERGVFVTLYRAGRLRGCIGCMSPSPLHEAVPRMASQSATNDPRFKPLMPEELPELKIEVSILSPMKKISGPEEIQIGKHGVCVKVDGASGTFLPQVAEEQGWDAETLLSKCCTDKLGIPADSWRRGEVYVYESEVTSTILRS